MDEIRQEINLKTIIENYHNIQNYIGHASHLIPVVKADAYGHGAKAVSSSLKEFVDAYFAVVCTQEAIELRKNEINNNILVLGRLSQKDIVDLFEYQLTPVVSNFIILENIAELAKLKRYMIPIHIEFNTGMNRLGFSYNDLDRLIEFYKKYKDCLNIIGIMSHFSSSESDLVQTDKQLDIFNRIISEIKHDINIRYYHIANSGAILNNKNSYFNAVRAGIMLYGYYPKKIENNPVNIKPAMSIKSFILSKHLVRKGEGISYGPSFVADRDMDIAVVAFGYADGLFRALSNKFSVIVNDKLCRSVGTICMDMFTIDVSDVDVKVGDEVIILGESENCKVDADDLAQLSSTISYEILVNIGKSFRVKRVYI